MYYDVVNDNDCQWMKGCDPDACFGLERVQMTTVKLVFTSNWNKHIRSLWAEKMKSICIIYEYLPRDPVILTTKNGLLDILMFGGTHLPRFCDAFVWRPVIEQPTPKV